MSCAPNEDSDMRGVYPVARVEGLFMAPDKSEGVTGKYFLISPQNICCWCLLEEFQ